MSSNLTNQQFNFNNRYRLVGLGSQDITNLAGLVRRVQEQPMKISPRVKDYVFTFWMCPFSRPGSVLRVTIKGVLAEEVHDKIKVGVKVQIDGNIVPKNFDPYVIASAVKITELPQAPGTPSQDPSTGSMLGEGLGERLGEIQLPVQEQDPAEMSRMLQ